MRRRQGRARGQALVETALGLLVFVTILVFAIHFSEIGFISLKVQEAATSALWDSTGGKMHTMPGPTSPIGTFDSGPAVAAASADAQDRYQDFDGRLSKVGATSIYETFTQASGMTVSCRDANAPSFPGFLGTLMILGVLRDNNGVSCSANATVDAYNFPSSFVDTGSGALFKKANRGYTAPLTICAVGRASGGSCRGAYSMLLDDWGFNTGMETQICPLFPNSTISAPVLCPNLQYWWSAGYLYSATELLSGVNTGAATRLERFVMMPTGGSPLGSGIFGFMGGEDAYWMSFTPGLLGHLQLHFPIEIDSFPIFFWPTAPGSTTLSPPQYMSAAGSRNPCFMGQVCN